MFEEQALASGAPWLRPRSPGFKGELQRPGCVNVPSFVPAQGRKTSQCPLLPQDGNSDPGDTPRPLHAPVQLVWPPQLQDFPLIKAAMEVLISVGPAQLRPPWPWW